MTDLPGGSRSDRLDRALQRLLSYTPEIEAAAVVSFDGLPMASALPASMNEERVAAMSAALLSLGERAAEGLGRGELAQVYVEGDTGTVFLVPADDEAVLVAVAVRGAKVGLMLYEVRRTAAAVAAVMRADDPVTAAPPLPPPVPLEPVPFEAVHLEPVRPEPAQQLESMPVPRPQPEQLDALAVAAAAAALVAEQDGPEPAAPLEPSVAPSWSSYAPNGVAAPGAGSTWS